MLLLDFELLLHVFKGRAQKHGEKLEKLGWEHEQKEDVQPIDDPNQCRLKGLAWTHSQSGREGTRGMKSHQLH